MIISTNRNPDLAEFKTLVDNVTLKLNEDAAKRSSYYLERNAQLLEDDVKKFLDICAKETSFKDTIEKISGQRFPDIVAGKYFGVEVKSSKDDNWVTLGGSVNESTRVEDVKNIFLIYGKLKEPIEFRSRPYEDCLSEVVVTHYPRYRIDMNLKNGETIFDKMNTTYDNLRLSDNPVGEIVNYYRSQLRDGESLWWTGIEAAPIKIRFWRTLSAAEKEFFTSAGFALFPEILGNSQKKYENLYLWLSGNHSIVSPCLRDSFSSKGRGTINTAKETFKNLPRTILNVNKNKNEIKKIILNTEENKLRETWKVNTINSDRVGQWIDIIAKLCKIENHSIHTLFNAIFDR